MTQNRERLLFMGGIKYHCVTTKKNIQDNDTSLLIRVQSLQSYYNIPLYYTVYMDRQRSAPRSNVFGGIKQIKEGMLFETGKLSVFV